MRVPCRVPAGVQRAWLIGVGGARSLPSPGGRAVLGGVVLGGVVLGGVVLGGVSVAGVQRAWLTQGETSAGPQRLKGSRALFSPNR